MDDKKIGYIILALLFCVIVLVLGYGIWILAFPKETYIIAFNRIGNIKIEDQVKIKGVTVGKIKQITKNKKKVLVTFNTQKPINIYKGYKIFSTDKGILGDRVIHLETGDTNSSIINKNDTLYGEFYPGVSEALGSAWKLRDLVSSFKTTAELFLSGSPEKPSFISTFNKILSEIDTFSNRLYEAAAVLNAEVSPKIGTLNTITASAKKISQEITATVPENIHTIEELVETLSNFIDKLDKLVNTLTDIVSTIKSNELIQEEHISQLNIELNKVRDVIHDIQVGALNFKLKVKLGY